MKRTTINKPLIPLKVILFCWYGASSCLLPYQTIHMRQLGITVEETAIIYTFLPFTQIFGPPVAGMIADRFGRYKPVLLVCLILCVVFSTVTLLVPTIPPVVVESRSPTVRHSSEEGLNIDLAKCPEQNEGCERISSDIPLTLRITKCKYECDSDKTYRTNVLGDVRLQDHQNLPENITLVGRLFHQTYSNNRCAYSLVLTDPEDAKSLLDQQDDDNLFRNWSKAGCVLSCAASNITFDEPTRAPVFTSLNCINKPNRHLTFWLYFVIRIVFQTVLNVCFSLLDATALALVEHHQSDFGRQRFWAILATAIFSPVTGIAIDFISEYRKYEDYSPAYYFFDVLVIATTLFVGTLNIAVAPPEKNVLKNVCRLLRLPEVLAFMIVVFCLGTIWGFIESFLFWYLLDLGSPKFLLGLTLTASAVAGLPFLHESQWFVKKIGRVNLLIVALFVYFVRCFGYSYINNPWWCIPFESMEVFTYHLMWVAAATYSANLVPKGLLATIQGCVGGLHFGVGRGAGSLIGGNIMHFSGARMAFRLMGVAGGVIGILYAFIYYTVLRRFKSVEEIKKRQLEEELAREMEMDSKANIDDENDTCASKPASDGDPPPSQPMIQNNPPPHDSEVSFKLNGELTCECTVENGEI